MKIFLDWEYKIKPKNDSWTSSSYEDCDLVIIVDQLKKYSKPSITWLYEPIAIKPKIYQGVYGTGYNLKTIVATHKLNLDVGTNKKIIIPPCFPSWIGDHVTNIYPKTKLVNMIASMKKQSEGHRFRCKVANSLENKIDVFGKGRKKCNPNASKYELLKDYMFSVCMENCIEDTYYTEKIIDCFRTGTIPIYWGTKKILDIFDGDGILFLNKDGSLPEISEDLYNKKMKAIKNNFELAKKYNYDSSDAISFIVDAYKKLK